MDSLMQENKDKMGWSKLFWVIMIIGTLLIGGLIAYLAVSPAPPAQEARLENAIREGSPEFESLRQRISVIEDHDYTTQTQSLAGGIQMQIRGKVRNFTGKIITGLEVVASVIDQKNNVIREKTSIVIPSPQASSIENNKTAPIVVIIDGFKQEEDRANFKFRVTGIKTSSTEN